MRTSLSQQIHSALVFTDTSSTKLIDAQNHAVSGKRILKPSDDVPGTNLGLSLRSAIHTADQYANNIGVTKPLVTATMNALDRMIDCIQSVNVIANKAANTQFTESSQKNAVAELEGILSQMADLANTKHMDQFVFSGTATDIPAVTKQAGTNTYAYTGNSEVKKTQILSWVNLSVSIPGDKVFNYDQSAGAGTTDVFTMITQLQDAITVGDPTAISNELANINANLDNLSSCNAQMGTWSNRMDGAKDILDDSNARLKEMLSDTEDIDLPTAVINLKTQENIYQTALMVTSRMLDLSLASMQIGS